MSYEPEPWELEPLSSFQVPNNLPTADPTAGRFVHICYAEAWQALVLGCLFQLLQEQAWNTDDPQALILAQNRADMLISMFQSECDDMPTGTIIFFGGDSAPEGYLVCDGSAISRANYAALFGVIGVKFGIGDGSTTFNLPDLGGRLPIGVGQQSGGTLFEIADSGGEETHTLITAEMPSHGHTDAGHTHTIGGAITGAAVMPGEGPVLIPSLPSLTGTGYASIQNTGGDGAHNNLPPYLALTPCIKY